MRRWHALIVGLATSTALAASAAAADLGGARRAKAPPPPPPPIIEEAAPFSWTGFYVGAHLGYGWTDIDWQEVPAFNGSHDGEGVLAGAQAGYNWQYGRFVYGVEADISSLWIDGGNACCDHEMSWLYSVRGRLGLTGYDNRTLYYVTGGGAWADIDYASVGRFSNNHFGWVIGGGIERALTPGMTARIEYLYYDFDDVTTSGALVPGSAVNLDPSMHTVRLGINYKF
jgi:outer membrane immunogenic protein